MTYTRPPHRPASPAAHPVRKRPTKAVYLRRRIAVFGGAALVLAGLMYAPLTLFAPLPAAPAVAENATIDTPAAPSIGWPGYGASALGAVGFDGVLAHHGSSGALPLASITKIVTALVVLGKKPLDAGSDGPTVTMSSSDIGYYTAALAQYGQVLPVQSGWTFSERQLLQLMLIHSANNYAQSTAVWAYGSMDAFLAAARSWLSDHGLTSIKLYDATGLDARNVGTAADLVELGRIALADPVVSAITSTRHLTLPHVGVVSNTNDLLGVDGVIGIKTGTLTKDNLLFAANETVGARQVTIIGVVLGAPDHPTLFAAAKKLVADAAAGFHDVQLATAGEPFASYTTSWGAHAEAQAAQSSDVLVWGATPVSVTVDARGIGHGSAGDAAGQVEFAVGEQSLTVPLVLGGPIDDPGPGWRLGHPGIIVGVS